MKRPRRLLCLCIGWSIVAFGAIGLAQETGAENESSQQPQTSQPEPQKHLPVLGTLTEFALATDLEYYEPAPGFNRQNRDIDLQVVRAALAAHFQQGWEFQFDALAFHGRGTEADTSTPPVPSNAAGVGAGPTVRWNFLQLDRWRLFLDAQGDLILANRPFPVHGSSYDFFLRAGGGASFRLSHSNWLESDFRFAHISNGQCFCSSNPAWNGRGFAIGIRHTLGTYPEAPQKATPSDSREPGANERAWTTSAEEYRAVPGSNLQDPRIQHQLRALRISRSWPLPKKFEFQFGGIIGDPIHAKEGNQFGGIGPLLRWNFLHTEHLRLFADAGADLIFTGSPAFVIPFPGDGYNFFARGGSGASFRLHSAFWLDAGFRYAHVTTGFGPSEYSYLPWSGLGVSLALRHTFR